MEKLLVRHGAPTLAGLKTGCLFRCRFSSVHTVCAQMRDLNRRLMEKGLRVLPLKLEEKAALIYAYRPQKLRRDLSAPAAMALLEQHGYPCGSPSRCIGFLIKRLRRDSGFPHEVGLFLGYPPEDVRGFIENGAQASRYVGCWKVYGDTGRARQLFRQYRKCTEVYARCYHAGKSIDKLTVSTQFVN